MLVLATRLVPGLTRLVLAGLTNIVAIDYPRQLVAGCARSAGYDTFRLDHPVNVQYILYVGYNKVSSNESSLLSSPLNARNDIRTEKSQKKKKSKSPTPIPFIAPKKKKKPRISIYVAIRRALKLFCNQKFLGYQDSTVHRVTLSLLLPQSFYEYFLQLTDYLCT